MGAVISLKEFVETMELGNDELKMYVNVETGEFVWCKVDDLGFVEDGEDHDLEGLADWEIEQIELAREVLDNDDYQELPNRFEIHAYAIMQNFCDSLVDEKLQDRLLDKLHGQGAFRRFKEAVYNAEIEDQWFAFRKEAFELIAIKWLKKRGLPCQLPPAKAGGL